MSHGTEYGKEVSSVPRLATPTLNWTPATPTLSEAAAVRLTVPVRVEPPEGEVIEIAGAIVSALVLLTVTVTAAEAV